MTNSKKIQNFIDDQFEEDKTSESTHQKVRRIILDIHTDNFMFDFTDIIKLCHKLEPTKRNILRIQGMFYDSLGLFLPITLPIKLYCKNYYNLNSNGINILMQSLVSYGTNILQDLNMLVPSL